MQASDLRLVAKTFSMNSTEEIVRKIDSLKWDEEFYCCNCGHKGEYTKGKKAFSRRCPVRECRYEESLQMNTAFENMRLPLEKAYNILDCAFYWTRKVNYKYIIARFDDEGKLMPMYRSKAEKEEYMSEADTYSSREIIDRMEKELKDNDGNKEIEKRYHSLLERYADRYWPTVKQLSKKFSVQENTIALLFIKVYNWIPENDLKVYHTKFMTVIQYMDHFHEFEDYLETLLKANPNITEGDADWSMEHHFK